MSEWRQIPSFQEYEASDDGCVRRRDSLRPARVWKWERYWLVQLRRGPNNWMTRSLHRVVAEAFLGPPPTQQHQAAHNDGDVDNNAVSNLRWATPRENVADRNRHGTSPVGERNGRAICSEAAVLLARRLRATGLSFAKIGKRIGVSKRQAMRICRREQWKGVPDQVASLLARVEAARQVA